MTVRSDSFPAMEESSTIPGVGIRAPSIINPIMSPRASPIASVDCPYGGGGGKLRRNSVKLQAYPVRSKRFREHWLFGSVIDYDDFICRGISMLLHYWRQRTHRAWKLPVHVVCTNYNAQIRVRQRASPSLSPQPRASVKSQTRAVGHRCLGQLGREFWT